MPRIYFRAKHRSVTVTRLSEDGLPEFEDGENCGGSDGCDQESDDGQIDDGSSFLTGRGYGDTEKSDEPPEQISSRILLEGLYLGGLKLGGHGKILFVILRRVNIHESTAIFGQSLQTLVTNTS